MNTTSNIPSASSGGGRGRGSGSGGGGAGPVGGGTVGSGGGGKSTHSRSYPRGVGLDFRKLAGLTLMGYIDHHGTCNCSSNYFV